jgi:hypothetical protein
VSRTSQRTPPSEALVFGQAFEDLVYGLPIHDRYAVKPEGMSFATKDGKAWKADAEASGKPIISRDDYDAMVAMRDSLRENGTAMRMIEMCCKQTTFRCDYPGTPGLQSRPDWDSTEGCLDSGYQPFTLDLKSTISLAKLTSGRGVHEHGYHAQAAIAAETIARHGLARPASFLLAVEKSAPYRSQVIEVTDEWIQLGWGWCERQLERLAGHYASGDWPRTDREVVRLPPVQAWMYGVNETMGEDEV